MYVELYTNIFLFLVFGEVIFRLLVTESIAYIWRQNTKASGLELSQYYPFFTFFLFLVLNRVPSPDTYKVFHECLLNNWVNE